MFFYARNLGSGKQYLVEFDTRDPVRRVRQFVEEQEPEYEVTRVIFAGQILDEALLLGYSGIYKECVVQLMTRKRGGALSLSPEPRSVALSKRHTDDGIAFGDVVLVNVLQARGLHKSRFRALKPYVLIVMDKSRTTHRTSIKKGRFPVWKDQLFGFILESGFETSESVHLSVWSHSLVLTDSSLGGIQIQCSLLPKDQTITEWIALQNAPGELLVSLRRASITSGHMREVIEKLCQVQKGWSSELLRRFHTTLSMIVGESPWLIEETGIGRNPAIEHLSNLLEESKISLSNTKTRGKVHTLLKSQNVIHTNDMPSRFLWVTNMSMNTSLLNTLQSQTQYAVKYFISHPQVTVLVFKSAIAALSTLLYLNNDSQESEYGFLPNPKWPFVDYFYCGCLDVSVHHDVLDGRKYTDDDEEETLFEFRNMFGVLTKSKELLLYDRLVASTPKYQYSLMSWSILNNGPFSIELHSKDEQNDTLNARLRSIDHDTPMDAWLDALRECLDDHGETTVSERIIDTFKCAICEQLKPLDSHYVYDSDTESDVLKCRECSENRVKCAFSKSNLEGVLEAFSWQDIQDLLPKTILDGILEKSVDGFLDSSKHIVKCPQCDYAFESWAHHWSSKTTHVARQEVGIDNKPLTEKAKSHFLENRFRCRQDTCGVQFCRLCGVVPYHLGFDCEVYQEFVDAPKCKFCGVGVLDHNRMSQSDLLAIGSVCDSPDCSDKALKACSYILECGHHCYGVKDETNHPPCLHTECSTGAQNSDDLCPICYVEDLGQAPVIQLQSCGHIFHYHCVLERFENRWSGKRITFNYCQCVICNSWMSHRLISEQVDQATRFLLRMREQTWRLIVPEGLDSDIKVTDPASEFFSQPVMYGLTVLSFFLCCRCNIPFFGGRVECGAADDAENDDTELVCGPCMTRGVSECDNPAHADAWIYKCRYCCTPAIWYCFGTTHFCDLCHNGNRSGMPCPPDGKKSCPLGLPPESHRNGEDGDCELVIGCGLCSDKYSEVEMKYGDDPVLTEREIEALRQSQSLLLDGSRCIEEDIDVTEFIGTLGGTQHFMNSANLGLLKLSSSTLMGSNSLNDLVDCGGANVVTNSIPFEAYVGFDFKHLSLECTSIELKSQSSDSSGFMTSFVLEVSNAGIHWETVLTVEKSGLYKFSQAIRFSIDTPKRSNMYRIRVVGPGTRMYWNVALGGVKLYGTLYPALPRLVELEELLYEDFIECELIKEGVLRWSAPDSGSHAELRNTGRSIRTTGGNIGSFLQGASSPLVPRDGLSYFEVYVREMALEDGMDLDRITIGVSEYAEFRFGNASQSYGFGGSFGCGYTCTAYSIMDGIRESYGKSYGETDLIGCCIDNTTGTVWFSLNGVNQGVAFQSPKLINKELYPVVKIDGRFGEVMIMCSESVFMRLLEESQLLWSQRKIYLAGTFGSLQTQLIDEARLDTVWDTALFVQRFGDCVRFLNETEIVESESNSLVRFNSFKKQARLPRVSIRALPGFSHGCHYMKFTVLGSPSSTGFLLGACLESSRPVALGDSLESWGVSWGGKRVALQSLEKLDGVRMAYGKSFMILELDLDKKTLCLVQGLDDKILLASLPNSTKQFYFAVSLEDSKDVSITIQRTSIEDLSCLDFPTRESATPTFEWAYADPRKMEVDIKGNICEAENNPHYLVPPVAQGLAVLQVEVVKGGNLGIGFADEKYGVLSAPWVGGGPHSYSIWSHGNNCNGDQLCRFERGHGVAGSYAESGSKVRLTVDMDERTCSYDINGVYAGRFVNLPECISFVVYLNGSLRLFNE